MSTDDPPLERLDDPDEPEEGEPAPPDATETTESAADPKRVTKTRARRKKAEDEAADFWRACLANEVGRREIWNVLTTAHTFEVRFGCGPNGFPQPEATWLNLGEQLLGQRFYEMLQRIDPQGALLMRAEHDPAWQKPKPQRKPKSRSEG